MFDYGPSAATQQMQQRQPSSRNHILQTPCVSLEFYQVIAFNSWNSALNSPQHIFHFIIIHCYSSSLHSLIHWILMDMPQPRSVQLLLITCSEALSHCTAHFTRNTNYTLALAAPRLFRGRISWPQHKSKSFDTTNCNERERERNFILCLIIPGSCMYNSISNIACPFPVD